MRLRRSRLSDNQTERLLEHFVAGTPARASAALVGVNRNTARLFYHRMREVIVQRLGQASPFQGEAAAPMAIDSPGVKENGGQRRPPTRAPLFGLIESNGKVHTVLLRNHRPDAAPGAAGAGPRLDAIVYADFHLERQALHVSSQQRVADSSRPSRSRRQFDSIENFWSQSKRHLHRYNGIPRHHFHLFLKECEWRFNHGSPTQLLKVLKAWISSSLP